MNDGIGTCAVAGCVHSGEWEIVWTNDVIYRICDHHSDSVLRPGANLELPGAVARRSRRREVRTTTTGPRPMGGTRSNAVVEERASLAAR